MEITPAVTEYAFSVCLETYIPVSQGSPPQMLQTRASHPMHGVPHLDVVPNTSFSQ